MTVADDNDNSNNNNNVNNDNSGDDRQYSCVLLTRLASFLVECAVCLSVGGGRLRVAGKFEPLGR